MLHLAGRPTLAALLALSLLQAVARPIFRCFEVGLLHEVHEFFSWAIGCLLYELDLHQHLSGALEIALQIVLETLVKHVEEDLGVAVAHLEQILVSLEEKGHVDLAEHDRLLKGVPVETGLDSGRALLLFIQVALLGFQGKVIHLDVAGVQ